MEKERFLEPTSVVDEPHFEEEWTVLAAQPVVPLKDVRTSQNVRGVIKLIAAFVGAGLLGVVVALASIRLRQVSGSTMSTDGTDHSELTESAPDETSRTGQALIAPEVEAAPVKALSRVTEAAKRGQGQNATSAQNASDTENDSTSSQAQLADEWQERRPRRTKIRLKRREIDELHHRGLTRIQEIFEGQRP